MKKALCFLCMMLMLPVLFTGCKNGLPQATATTPAGTGAAVLPTVTPLPTATPVPILVEEVDLLTEQWKMTELVFHSEKDYSKPFYDVDIEATFTAPDGTLLVMPGFWDGDDVWKVRFAPTMCGKWTYKTSCTDTSNSGLHEKSGVIGCNAYSADLEIYKHGFIKTVSGQRYMMYDDGTPFFYLGDTHWFMSHERFDTSNKEGVASQFKYIVDKRVEQHFTVYQSEPIQTNHKGSGEEASYDLRDFSRLDLDGFTNLDRKFQYIADKGLVHANAELFFASELQSSKFSEDYIKKLTRYWVARYAAYPVLWTTAQEVDPTFYGVFTREDNPWYNVAEALAQYDPYQHPITAHTSTGELLKDSTFDKKPYHSWFALQWSYERNAQLPFEAFKKNYDGTAKPIVLYESRYDGFWETDYRLTRNQAYTAWLLGMYGHGYGANGVWNDLYSDPPTEGVNGDWGCVLDMPKSYLNWYDGANSPGGEQMRYVAQLYQSMQWWRLTPRFDDETWSDMKGYYVLASIENTTYVAYFYNLTKVTGTLKNMQNAPYEAKWYNPRTGEYTIIGTATPANGQWVIPDKPDGEDWVLVVNKK